MGVQELADKGLERKPRLLALKRQAVDLEGEQGEYTNRIAQAREAIAESELEIIRMEADDQREVATELREVQMRLAEVREKLAAAQVRQGRRDVTAPEAGTVLHMRYFSPGAVVAPGGPILDLVPRDDRLVIEARVRPTDIDVVHVGLPAKVIFSAFKMRTTPQLEGTVSLVSADAMTDERTGVTYYTARVAVDADGTRQAGRPPASARHAGGNHDRDRRAHHDGIPAATHQRHLPHGVQGGVTPGPHPTLSRGRGTVSGMAALHNY